MINEDESMVDWYAARATPGLPAAQSERVFALMAEVDRGRERRRDESRRKPFDRAEYERDSAERAAQRDAFLAHCRPATAAEYTAWLTGYQALDGKVTHRYSYPFPSGDWWILESRADVVPSLYGAQSVHVIVPADVPFTPRDVPATFHGACGHSSFYFLDGFRRCAQGWVPQYNDTTPFGG